MSKKSKLTPWNPWDHIVTVEEAKDYVEAIYEEWDEESKAANDCLVEVLESYMEFIKIMEKTLVRSDLPKDLREYSRMLVMLRKGQWGPVLDQAKKKQKAQKSAKKTA